MIIHPDSHLDHNLTIDHLRFLLETLAEYDEKADVTSVTLTLPDNLPALPVYLIGPVMGDPPVPEEDVEYKTRGNRSYPTRVLNWEAMVAVGKKNKEHEGTPHTRLVTVHMGEHKGHACVMYTAHSGPEAPREPGDENIASDEERRESIDFWEDHAILYLGV